MGRLFGQQLALNFSELSLRLNIDLVKGRDFLYFVFFFL